MTVAWAAVEKMTMSYNNFNLHQNEACKFYVVQMIPRNIFWQQSMSFNSKNISLWPNLKSCKSIFDTNFYTCIRTK